MNIELKDLILQHHYRVEKVLDGMVAIEDDDGNYRSTNAMDVERALTNRQHTDSVYVRMKKGGRWYPISRSPARK